MNNPFISMKKTIIIVFGCMSLLSPLLLIFFPLKNFTINFIYSILCGAILFGIAHFLAFKLNLDTDDSENINEENKGKFKNLLLKENKIRIVFFYVCIASAVATAITAAILNNMFYLLIAPAAYIAMFVVFQYIISAEDIPLLKKKMLNENIDNNLSFISKKTDEEESFEKRN